MNISADTLIAALHDPRSVELELLDGGQRQDPHQVHQKPTRAGAGPYASVAR